MFVGASSCVGSGTVQGRGGFGLSSGGSGNGDEDPDERPTEYKRVGGCSSDEGVCTAVLEEQPSHPSASMELVPGTSKGHIKAYQNRMEEPAVGRDAGVMSPQVRPLPKYLAIPALGPSKQQMNPNPYGDSDQAYDGEEWQGQRDVRNKQPPPMPPPGLPEQVTSPEVRLLPGYTYKTHTMHYQCCGYFTQEMQQPKQMVGTPSRGKMVVPPIPMNAQALMPLVQEETAQLLVYPPDDIDWAAAQQHGQTVSGSCHACMQHQ